MMSLAGFIWYCVVGLLGAVMGVVAGYGYRKRMDDNGWKVAVAYKEQADLMMRRLVDIESRMSDIMDEE